MISSAPEGPWSVARGGRRPWDRHRVAPKDHEPRNGATAVPISPVNDYDSRCREGIMGSDPRVRSIATGAFRPWDRDRGRPESLYIWMDIR